MLLLGCERTSMETFVMFASCHLGDAYCLFLCWEAITTWRVALLTFVCVYLSYEENKSITGSSECT